MSDISEQLLDALMLLPQVKSLWLRPNNRRGSHFSRASEDLLIEAPAIDDAQWHQLIELVEKHEKWHLISVFKLENAPMAGAKQVRPQAKAQS